MSYEIHPANPSAEDRRVMEQAIKLLHEDLKRDIQNIGPNEDPAGRLLMVMQDGTISTIQDLSRTQEDADEFFAQMRRVVAKVKPAFVAYANLCEPEPNKPGEEAIQFVAESLRRACAIGTAGVRRRSVRPPQVDPATTEFLSHGDVVVTSFGAFYAGLTGENDLPTPTLH